MSAIQARIAMLIRVMSVMQTRIVMLIRDECHAGINTILIRNSDKGVSVVSNKNRSISPLKPVGVSLSSLRQHMGWYEDDVIMSKS